MYETIIVFHGFFNPNLKSKYQRKKVCHLLKYMLSSSYAEILIYLYLERETWGHI